VIDLDSCKFVVWGFRTLYRTHTHIHAGFFRTLQGMGKDAQWLDAGDDISGIDFSNTFFITEHEEARRGMPLRDDCFYTVHGLSDDAALKEQMAGIKNRLSWNVYHDFSHFVVGAGCVSHGSSDYVQKMNEIVDSFTLADVIELDEDVMFYPREKHIEFRWATDLLPEEIHKNKPQKVFRDTSDVIHYIGTLWFVNQTEIAAFKRACDENKIRFEMSGAGQNGVVTREDNEKLVKDSYMAPAISGSHHLTEGYAPCRIFKNISYGQYGITNSARVQKIFGGKLIFNPDPYKLFYEARERLQSTSLDDLYKLMDEVAAKHTYVNRINNILTAARLILQ